MSRIFYHDQKLNKFQDKNDFFPNLLDNRNRNYQDHILNISEDGNWFGRLYRLSYIKTIFSWRRNLSFPLWIFSVNVAKSAGKSGFGHIY